MGSKLFGRRSSFIALLILTAGSGFALAPLAVGQSSIFPGPDDIAVEPQPVGGTATALSGEAYGLDWSLRVFNSDQGGKCLDLYYSGPGVDAAGGACGFETVPSSDAIAVTQDFVYPTEVQFVSGPVSKEAAKVLVSYTCTVPQTCADADGILRLRLTNAGIADAPGFDTNFFAAALPMESRVTTIAAATTTGEILDEVQLP